MPALKRKRHRKPGFPVIRRVLSHLIPLLLVPAQLLAAPLRIGVIGGLTGPVAPYGLAAKNGLMMALEDFSAQELLEVHFEDDQFIPSRTVSSYLKLTHNGSIDAVMATGSTPALALAPLTKRDRLPFIACASDLRVSKGNPNVVRNWVSGRAEGEALADTLIQLGAKRLALIYATDDYSRAVIEGAREHLGDELVVVDDEISADTHDFLPLLGRLMGAQAGSVGLCLNAGQPGLFARQLRQQGIRIPLAGCLTLESESEWKQAAGALSGARYIAVPVQEWFRERYQRRYGNDTVISVAAAFYDAGTLLVRLAKQEVGRTGLIEALQRLPEQEGALGRYSIRNSPDGLFFDFQLTVKTVP